MRNAQARAIAPYSLLGGAPIEWMMQPPDNDTLSTLYQPLGFARKYGAYATTKGPQQSAPPQRQTGGWQVANGDAIKINRINHLGLWRPTQALQSSAHEENGLKRCHPYGHSYGDFPTGSRRHRPTKVRAGMYRVAERDNDEIFHSRPPWHGGQRRDARFGKAQYW